jgi:tetratricopeptide (TPR) repeat protein
VPPPRQKSLRFLCDEGKWLGFVLAIAIPFIGGIFLSSCSPTAGPQAIEDYSARAKKLYEERDFRGAISAYEDLLRLQPSYAEANYQIALIYDRNLNEYLNAAYYYQKFLQSKNADPTKIDLVKGFSENAKLQFAASVPNAGGQNSPELVRLRSENTALCSQVEDLKRELVQTRPKPVETVTKTSVSNSPPQKIEVKSTPPLPPPPPVEPKRTVSRPKTYVVKKGEGIQAIAEKYYGDRSKWRQILSANPKIKDPNQLAPGQVLILP